MDDGTAENKSENGKDLKYSPKTSSHICNRIKSAQLG